MKGNSVIYEYYVISSWTNSGLQDALNRYAKDGWEPVTMTEDRGNLICILRRPKKD